ncbi:MAG: hypothetical protein KC502_15945 [Myxococcales bacterium]|nr:hypothetical protein [Myxococcales bacterium]
MAWLIVPLTDHFGGEGTRCGDKSDGPLTSALLVFGLGMLGGATGITSAHAAMHRSGWLDRAVAEVFMTTVSFPWWCVERVYGHHCRVATLEGGATSRLSERLYAFLSCAPESGLRSAWVIERTRLRWRKLAWCHPSSHIGRQTLTQCGT